MTINILEAVFEQIPETHLYHYTTQEGLKGIIDNNEIWCTHTQFLSDPSEYSYAVKILSKLIDDRIEKEGDEDTKKMLINARERANSGLETINVCVASFSEVGDSLSQWRAYGSETSGFAIGIDGVKLAQHVKEKEFFLARCIYTDEEQKELLDALIDEAIKDDKKTYEVFKEFNYISSIGELLNTYAPILKDEGFIEEKEWRIISPPMACSSDLFDHRPGRSMLIPYYKFPLVDTNGQYLFDRIIIGPTPHPKQSKASVHSLIVRSDFIAADKAGIEVTLENLKFTNVYPSNIPYRNW